jgi:hypothetical protein
MARAASVTVSIAAETMGIFKEMFRVKRDCVLTSLGKTSEYAGNNNTSSYVKASKRNLLESSIANKDMEHVTTLICRTKLQVFFGF